jgi:hypothetical protein
MAENSVYIQMRIEKEAIENIRNAMKNKDPNNIIGTLNLSIVIEGEGYAIPIKTTNYMSIQKIEKLINNGKYNIQYGNINLLYELKPVDVVEEDKTPDLISF